MKDKSVAAILALFLGGVGGHKFYLGQTGAGIVYVLFCWTFIPAFIGFIEFIILLSMSKEEFDARYNRALYAGTPLMLGTDPMHAQPPAAPVQNITIHVPAGHSRGAGRSSPGERDPEEADAESIAHKISELNALRISGAITDQEFQVIKSRLLQQLEESDQPFGYPLEEEEDQPLRQPAGPARDRAQQLKDLNELRIAGAITDTEYQLEKKRILGY
ncbi:MAG: NINE protein [Bradymonadales bacterium]|nr:NINE protein [Bradymonadales bacterium]